MSTKVANVIAIELGIVIALLVWLAIFQLPGARFSRAQNQAIPGDSFATVAPVVRANPQDLYARNDMPVRGAAARVVEELAQTAPEYAKDVAAEGYVNPAYVENFAADTTPYDAAVERVPVISSPDFYVAPVAQFVDYVQPSSIIVFSNTRSAGRPRRCLPRLSVARGPTTPPRRDGGNMPAHGNGLTPRQKPGIVVSPRQNPRGGGSAPRQDASARPPQQNHAMKARWDP